uniref:Uncharacterized protein n=1 Tax=Leptocylindrus danicus TaxID=163516 RepID=A0A7S2KC78_9STRA|mmetsp:Transcript_21055/g.31417  ORF Transcript_21055/g.31417 Transcript_21055/m.31417 type:complete len:157 (+) Transcript_21055:52-522(+)
MKSTIFLALAATTTAFTVPPVRTALTRIPTAIQGLMTEEESKSIIDKAHLCAESECNVEDVDMFLSELREQQMMLRNRLAEVTGMISELGTVNESTGEERKVDEIRETVRAIARIFMMGDKNSDNDYPIMGPPLGYTGEIGDGPKTAYDVLSPKKP